MQTGLPFRLRTDSARLMTAAHLEQAINTSDAGSGRATKQNPFAVASAAWASTSRSGVADTEHLSPVVPAGSMAERLGPVQVLARLAHDCSMMAVSSSHITKRNVAERTAIRIVRPTWLSGAPRAGTSLAAERPTLPSMSVKACGGASRLSHHVLSAEGLPGIGPRASVFLRWFVLRL